MKFPDRLVELRKSKAITQTELGQMLHLSRTAISNYETGKLEPSMDTLIKLSEIFNISLDELMKDTVK